MTTTFSPLAQEEHLRQSMSLQTVGYLELFEVTMRPPGQSPATVYITDKQAVNWQGKTWEKFPCQLTGHMVTSTGEQSRPVFSIVNPEGVFTKYTQERWMDSAQVIRYRVLKTHLDANINSFTKNTWRVAKTTTLTRALAAYELRGALDGHNFLLPGRAFYPPEFPHVSLS